MHIHGIQKDGTDEPICRAALETQTKRTDLQTQRRGGESEKCGENNMETYIAICKTDSQKAFAV